MHVGPTTVQTEARVKGLRTLSLEKVEGVRHLSSRACPSSWDVYKGTLEGAPVVVLVVKPHQNVTDVARQMCSVKNPCVAKVIGWCRDSGSIVVEGGQGGSLKDRMEKGLDWLDCFRTAHRVAHAAAYLEGRGFPVVIDSEMICFGDGNELRLVYLPVPSACFLPVHEFGMILREMLVRPLLYVNVTSQDGLKAELDPFVREWPEKAIEDLTQLTAACLGGDITCMQHAVIEASVVNQIALRLMHSGPTTVHMEESLRGILSTAGTLSLKQGEDAQQDLLACNSLCSGYRGTLEGPPVVVIVPTSSLGSAVKARQLQSVNHRYVANFLGWCADSGNIVVETGKGLSLKDRIERGLGWQDCCRIANQVALAVLYLTRRGMGVEVFSGLTFFDDNDNIKLAYLPYESKLNFACCSFGKLLREMLVETGCEAPTSQADLKDNLHCRVEQWPEDVIEELTRLAAKCLKVPFTSMEKVAEDVDRISQMEVKQEGKLYEFKQPILEQRTGLEAELELLFARREKLQRDLIYFQELAEKSKAKLPEVQLELLGSVNSKKDFKRRCNDMKLFRCLMMAEEPEEANLQTKLKVVEKDIPANRKMAVDLETAFEEERKLAMTHCESLRSVSLEKRGKVAVALNKYNMEKVASLANAAKALDEKVDELQIKYSFKLPMLELKPGFQ